MSEVHYNSSDSSCWTKRTHIYSIIHPSFASLSFGGTWFIPFRYIGLVKLVHILFLGGVKVHRKQLWVCSDPPLHVLFYEVLSEVGEKTLVYRLHHRWKQSNWITCARYPAESQGHQEKILKEKSIALPPPGKSMPLTLFLQSFAPSMLAGKCLPTIQMLAGMGLIL